MDRDLVLRVIGELYLSLAAKTQEILSLSIERDELRKLVEQLRKED